MPRRRRDRLALNAEINVVNLIDVMLLLLVIFMITAPMMQGGVDIQLPRAEARPLDPKSGQIVSQDISEQTRRVLDNLTAVLAAENLTFNHIVKTTIFYAEVEDFGRLNETYARHMPDPPPARSAPANVRLPRGLLVSIEAIAVLPTSSD